MFTSMASAPMETEPGGLVGVLNVHTIERRDLTPRDIELLLVIGRLIAGSLHQARLHRQLSTRERTHEDFAEQVIAAQESGRCRLAGDIHDGISQRLDGTDLPAECRGPGHRRCRSGLGGRTDGEGPRSGRPHPGRGALGHQRPAPADAR